MTFLRLGVACAVIDDDGHILLSQRGDMPVWNLPTGRLDAYEPLVDAAAREVFEETGVRVGVERPVGLYYLEASRRLNVLFLAYPLDDAAPVDVTDEARANAYFDMTEFPARVFADYMAQDAAHNRQRVLHILRTPFWTMQKIRARLAVRWVKNWLSGRPEPKHVRFEVYAVAVIWNEPHSYILGVPQGEGYTLPKVRLHGDSVPWNALSRYLSRMGLRDLSPLQWVGIRHEPSNNHVDLVFSGEIVERDVQSGAVWLSTQNHSFMYGDAVSVEQTLKHDAVWIWTEPTTPVDVISRSDYS